MENTTHVTGPGDTSPAVLKIVLLGIAMFAAMGGPALAPALPSIKAAYTTIPNIELWTKALVAISGLFAAVGAPLFGWLSDRYGRKTVLFITVSMWGIFGVSGMIPQPFWTLLAGRACLGLSLGGLMAANSAMIADYFTQIQRRHMMGLQSTFNSSGIVVSLIVSGLLAGIHWRAAFCVFLLALPLLPLIRSIRPPTHVACPPGTSAPGSAQSFPLWLLYFFGLSAMMAFNIIPTQLPFYLHSLEGASSAKIGIIIALLPIASAIAGRTYARFSQKINPWTYFIFPGAVMCAGFWLLSLSTHTPGFVLSMLLIGTGFGLTMPHVNIVLFSIVPPAAAGKSMGILAGAKFFGLFLSPFLAHPIIARFGYQEMLRASGGYIFFAAVTLSLVGLVAYIKKESTDDS